MSYRLFLSGSLEYIIPGTFQTIFGEGEYAGQRIFLRIQDFATLTILQS